MNVRDDISCDAIDADKVYGDTIINGKTYKKYFQAHPLFYGYKLFGFIREDSSQRKIYFLQKDSVKEFVLYDFSLKVGDSIHINISPSINPFYCCRSDWYKVLSVSSSSGVLTLQLQGKFTASRLDWYSDIGRKTCPIYVYAPGDHTKNEFGDYYTKLTCFFKREELIRGATPCYKPCPNGLADADLKTEIQLTTVDQRLYVVSTVPFTLFATDLLGRIIYPSLKEGEYSTSAYSLNLSLTGLHGVLILVFQTKYDVQYKKIYVQ